MECVISNSYSFFSLSISSQLHHLIGSRKRVLLNACFASGRKVLQDASVHLVHDKELLTRCPRGEMRAAKKKEKEKEGPPCACFSGSFQKPGRVSLAECLAAVSLQVNQTERLVTQPTSPRFLV